MPAKKAPKSQPKKGTSAPEKVVDNEAADAVSSVASTAAPAATDSAAPEAATAKEKKVTLTLKGLDKRGRNAIYTGAAVSIRIPVGAFPNKSALPTFDVDGLAGPKEKRAPMTPEERKAARAAQPKLSLADKVARAEERARKLREQLAANAGQPAGEAVGASA